jgi:signal transduction histidine kinase
VKGRDLAQARRLERGLIALRWLVVAFGGIQAALAVRDGPAANFSLPLALGLVAALAIGNPLMSVLVDRAASPGELRRFGLWAFGLDIVVVLGLVWASHGPDNETWVIAYILPLEGAIRYGLVGALVPVALTAFSEGFREASLADQLDRPYHVGSVAFRVGIQLAIAIVAGVMARSLEREADKARERARSAEEAAALAESAAASETQARRELSAFHTAILAGIAAEDFDEGLQSMADAVGRELRCRAFGVLLREDDPSGRIALVAKGVYGATGYERGARFGPGTPLADVAEAGRPVLHADPPEGIVPLKIGEDAIGLLHELPSDPSGMDRERLLVLGRLADQIALVAQAARLRARQDETVRRLKELDEMKSDFVAITSHELRTPLAAIRGFVNTLRRRLDQLSPEEAQEFLAIVDTQTDRLIRLVEDLLVVSRIEAGKLTLRAEEVELITLVEQVLRGIEAGERVAIHRDPRTPDTMLVDPQRLGQVLTNLLQNALKFSGPEPPVDLNIEPILDEAVRFAIVDRGPGIPGSERSLIFERFHQMDAASTRRSEGAGLGLYITRQLVEAMGGSIDLDSEVDVGSTFTVTIPLRPAHRARSQLFGAVRPD